MGSHSPRIEILGAFRVVSGRRVLSLSSPGEHVLAVLALARGPVTRERLAGTLWPEVDRKRSQARLRSTLWRLGSERSVFLETRGRTLRLAESCWVDLYEAEHVAHALSSSVPVGRQPDELLEMFGRDLLCDWYEPWLDIERDMYRQTRVHALESLARTFISDGEFYLAIRACMESIRCEPFRDSSHLLLVEAYRAEGNDGAALHHIRRYRETLRDELKASPGSSLTNLEAELMLARR